MKASAQSGMVVTCTHREKVPDFGLSGLEGMSRDYNGMARLEKIKKIIAVKIRTPVNKNCYFDFIFRAWE